MLGVSSVNLKNATSQEIQNEGQVNVQFRGTTKGALERNPQADSFEKKGVSKKTKILATTVAVIGLCTLGTLAFKGKLNFGQKNLKDVFNVREIDTLGYDDILKTAKEKWKTVECDELMLVKGEALKEALKSTKVKPPENENAIMLLLNNNGEPMYQEVFLPKKVTDGLKDLFNDKDVFAQLIV